MPCGLSSLVCKPHIISANVLPAASVSVLRIFKNQPHVVGLYLGLPYSHRLAAVREVKPLSEFGIYAGPN